MKRNTFLKTLAGSAAALALPSSVSALTSEPKENLTHIYFGESACVRFNRMYADDCRVQVIDRGIARLLEDICERFPREVLFRYKWTPKGSFLGVSPLQSVSFKLPPFRLENFSLEALLRYNNKSERFSFGGYGKTDLINSAKPVMEYMTLHIKQSSDCVSLQKRSLHYLGFCEKDPLYKYIKWKFKL